MAERANTQYTRLFEVRLLHHYWLDDGTTQFDALAADVQANRLLLYNMQPFFSVSPTPSTQRQLDGLRCIFKTTGAGFIVAAPSGTTIAATTQFAFMICVSDGQFFDYTAMGFRAPAIYEAFDPSDHSPSRIVYRYKENVPLLSNLTGASRTSGPTKTLFLSQDYPAPSASDRVEALVLSGAALLQLTSDNPAATTQSLGVAAALPVHVNQGDAPPITPPAGVTGAPARGVSLTDDVPDNVFALITLTAVRGDDDSFSFVDGMGAPKVPPPVYQVRFKNRSTLWSYLDKQTGAVNATEAAPLPLTFFGNAGTKQKPSRGIVKAQQSGAKITQLISEIYV
ncbi:MAG: hypothetical protein P4L57_01045 [Rhizomicrobium sp.]|nr:hypothetical protein [Rhizomicrobium sp.]